MTSRIHLICFIFYWLCSYYRVSLKDNDIQDLQILGDYRSIKLKWSFYSNPDEYNFKIRCCEMNNWPMRSRCKDQIIEANQNDDDNEQTIISHRVADPDEAIIEFKKIDPIHYEASINSLRVQTNYSVSVRSILKGKKDGDDDDEHVTSSNQPVMVTTKSFNAKTLRCLANSSEIQVFTGPYFGGRISVEESDNPACFINGDKSDPKESYNFTINHNLCKSKTIDNTRIESMVLVNENREILTHNSRRYLVICGFDPDKYTLTASVAVPQILLKKFTDRIRGKPTSIGIVSRVEPPSRRKYQNKDDYYFDRMRLLTSEQT